MAIVLILVLLAVDAVLVGAALAAHRSSGAGPETTSERETPSVEPSATAEQPEPSTSPDETTEAAPRLLAAVSEFVAWRAVQGSCAEGGGALETTNDGGQTWTSVAPSDPAPAEILEVAPGVENARGSVVYSDATCAVNAQRTFTSGAGWEPDADALARATYTSAEGAVAIAGEEIPDVCARPLAAADAGEGAVLCDDGLRVRSGGVWAEAQATDVLAISADGDALYAAQGPSDSCTGVTVSAIEAGSASELACVDDLAALDRVSLAVTGSIAWIWAGDETRVVSLG